ncbi:type VI secretion protein [Methylomonas lenta]|uniref:Type VI secretion protein n=1 Tax=Methylomonas lenta TaxID=980561 RepID=A0A177NIG5_9GAMM|nr:type VI secretion system lipoprotein TssJ [Methylomonas lenta]OAI17642.1 type VI secretion protein [Methylomonas lenta]
MKHSLSLFILAVFLQGCAGDPPVEVPPLPPTIVNLQINPAADLNADINGNGAPVMLRIYELREQSNFKSADFFALFNDDKATLAADLARKQELLLQPGDAKNISLQPEDDVRAVGLFAGFRQLDTAQWRVVTPFKAHETQTLVVTLKNNQMTLETAP